MGVTLQIKRMSREEKLRAMEELWTDLTRDEGKFNSPAWHGTVLRQTEQKVREGSARFSDWAAAKARIRRNAAKVV